MKNKKSKVFLYISFVFFSLTVIEVFASGIWEYHQVQETFANDPRRITEWISCMKVILFILIIPVLALELSGIRSTYKLLKYKPKGIVKICYLISASLAFLAVAFHWLISIGLINFEFIKPIENYRGNFTIYLLLFIEWPSLILSFVLGSIPIKRND